jgi:hypothetical protein
VGASSVQEDVYSAFDPRGARIMLDWNLLPMRKIVDFLPRITNQSAGEMVYTNTDRVSVVSLKIVKTNYPFKEGVESALALLLKAIFPGRKTVGWDYHPPFG